MIKSRASPSPRASIVIVAVRDRPVLRQCLQRLAGLDDDVSSEVIAVLCGCDTAEAERLRREVGAVQVLHSEVNLGLAGALNLARESVRGEFLVSLHDDAEPAAGWLQALVSAADEDPGAGAIGSLVLNPDGSVQAAGARLLGTGATAPVWDGAPPPASAFTERRPADYCPSCSLLVRVSSWDTVGGADERFYPIYYVDVDLCLAIRSRGERVVCEPRSVVTHHRGTSSEREFAIFVSERNRDLLIEKWGAALSDRPARPELPEPERARDTAARERRQLLRLAEVNAAYAAQLRGERDRALASLAEISSRMAWLQTEADTLARVRSGGWWQLRGRLLPLVRVAASIRRASRRARRG